MEQHEARVLRLKSLVSRILREDGLIAPPGWHVQILPDGTLAVHDPASADGNPHGRLRAGIRIENSGTRPDEALAGLMAVQARAALRRMRTYPELRKADRAAHVPVGWSALAHPLAIAIGRSIGFSDTHLPPQRRLPDDAGHPRTRHPTLFERTVTWDLMSVTIGTTLDMGADEVNARLESKPGGTDIKLHVTLPETLVTALRGRPLAQFMALPSIDARVDAAVAGLTIGSAVRSVGSARPNGTFEEAVTLTIAPARWLPWGPPPEDVARLMELSPEVS